MQDNLNSLLIDWSILNYKKEFLGFKFVCFLYEMLLISFIISPEDINCLTAGTEGCNLSMFSGELRPFRSQNTLFTEIQNHLFVIG